MDGIIGMDEISKVLDLADELGFNREQIRVELTKEDPGVVEIVQGGNLSSFQEIVNITVPETIALDTWLKELRELLSKINNG